MRALLRPTLETMETTAVDAIGRLMTLVGPDLDRVNDLILARMQSPVPLIPELAGHLVKAGGKRLRPMLTLASARLSGYTGEGHLLLAAAVEFIHTATLLHDDVVDESALRRGRPTANAVWGNQASVLVGDFLFARAFQLMVETGSIEVLGILSRASAVIAEGEVMQLAAQRDLGTLEATYLEVIAAKTAALFEAAAQVGAVIAGRPEAEVKALARYGLVLGIAFQLVDDALDYSGREARMGKTVGDDFREGKVTLPVILAFSRGSEADRAFWRRTISEQRLEDGDLAHAIGLVEQTGAIGDALQRARAYAAEAKALLRTLPPGPYTDVLADVADFCVARAY